MNNYVVCNDIKINILSVKTEIISTALGGIELDLIIYKKDLENSNLTYEKLMNLFKSTSIINYYEDDILKCIYTNFNKISKCLYKDDTKTYNITLHKKLDIELLSEINSNDTINAYSAIAELYETKLLKINN